MPTANEVYQDRIISHQIGLRRLGNETLQRVVALLNRTRPDVRRLLLDRLDAITERGIDIGPATTARLATLEAELSGILRESHQMIAARITGDMEKLAAYEVDYQAKALNEVLPVRLEMVKPTPEMLQAVVYSQPFQGKVLRDWVSQFEMGDKRRIMDTIRMGMAEGETPTQIVRRVEGTQALRYKDGIRQVSRRGLQTLVQTASSHVANRSRQQWAVSSGVVEQEVYVATLDSKTSFQCASLDGRTFPVGKGPTPPIHPNCRSTRAPAIDGKLVGERPAVAVRDKDLEGLTGQARKDKIRELVGPVPAETSFNDWLKRQKPDFIEDYLGKSRAELYKSGQISLKDLVDRNGKPWTLDDLARREGVKLAA